MVSTRERRCWAIPGWHTSTTPRHNCPVTQPTTLSDCSNNDDIVALRPDVFLTAVNFDGTQHVLRPSTCFLPPRSAGRRRALVLLVRVIGEVSRLVSARIGLEGQSFWGSNRLMESGIAEVPTFLPKLLRRQVRGHFFSPGTDAGTKEGCRWLWAPTWEK